MSWKLEPPPFPVQFRSKSYEQTFEVKSHWQQWPQDTESKSLPSTSIKWSTVQTEGEQHVAVLERALAKAKRRFRSPPPPSGRSLSYGFDSEDDLHQIDRPKHPEGEGHALLEAAAPIAGKKPVCDDTSSHGSTSASDSEAEYENEDRFASHHEPMTQAERRIVSLSFAPFVKIGGNSQRQKKRPNTSRNSSSQHIYTPPRRYSTTSITQSPSPSMRPSSINIKRPSTFSRASSANMDNMSSSLVNSSVVSLASSPCSSIYAPLTQSNLTAPSPSRTMAIFQAQQLGKQRSGADPYKTLVREQMDRRRSLRRKSSGGTSVRQISREDEDILEESSNTWSSCLACCVPARNSDRQPLLQKPSDKTELDVRFGPKPQRWFTLDYWAYRLRRWTTFEDVPHEVGGYV